MDIFAALVHINFSSIGSTIFIKLQIQVCVCWQTKSPKLHRKWANWSNKYILHVTIHKRPIKLHTFAYSPKRRRNEKSVPFESSNLNLLFIALVKDVKIYSYYILIISTMNFNLGCSLSYPLAVYRQ
jgi:hypothetical protein